MVRKMKVMQVWAEAPTTNDDQQELVSVYSDPEWIESIGEILCLLVTLNVLSSKGHGVEFRRTLAD